MMRRALTATGTASTAKAGRLAVRIGEGETIDIAVRLVFGPDGALLRVLVPVGAGRLDPRDQAARLLVQRLDAELARPRDAFGSGPGMVALRREAELVLHLAEQLEALEETHGPAAARGLRLGAA